MFNRAEFVVGHHGGLLFGGTIELDRGLKNENQLYELH